MEAAKIDISPLHPPHTLLLCLPKTTFCFNPTHSNRTLASSAYRPQSKLLQFGLLLVIPKHRLHRLTPACCNHSDEFPDDCNDEELQIRIAKQVEEMMERGDDDEDNIFPNFFVDKREEDHYDLPCFRGFSNSQPMGTLKAPWRAIEPKRPYWHPGETTDSPSVSIRSNIFDLPISHQIMTCGERWKEGFSEAGESACCSAKKAFASMVFIIHEMQSYSLRLRETLSYEDLQRILVRVQKDMQASFVWLFQKIFSGTPILMVYVMLLLANFTVYSMGQSVCIAMAKLPASTVESMAEEGCEHPLPLTTCSINGGRNAPAGVNEGEDENTDVSSLELSWDEMELWNSVVDEAFRMQRESTDESLDFETMLQFVSPGKPLMEPNGYLYFWTELRYQRAIAEDPNNSLILSNYGQFIHQVYRDPDRAEEYFARAAMCEPADSEALSRYGRFMWHVRNDLWAAEENFIRALEADPTNAYYAGQYASFLHHTGAEDTCYPLE